MVHTLHMGFSGEVQNVQRRLKEICDYSQNVISEHFVFYGKQLVCVASGGLDRIIRLFSQWKNCCLVIINKEREAY